MPPTQTYLKINDQNPQHLILEFVGRLDMYTVPELWTQALAAQKKYLPDVLQIEAANISYCDGAGIALLQQLKEQQTSHQKQYMIQHLNPSFQTPLDLVSQPPPSSKEIQNNILCNRLACYIGYATVSVAYYLKNQLIFMGALCYYLLQAVIHPKTLRWKDLWQIAEDVGPKAFPIIALIGFLVGLITTFQAAPSFGQFGAQIYMVNLVSLGLIREMGPLMTAVLLAGRTASSFAAELGTMKINQEIDALKTLGLNPIKFLVIPRTLATMMMTPLLNVFLILFGIIGCGFVMNTLGYPLEAFLTQLKSSVDVIDCIGGLVKVFVFGLVISAVGCLHGLNTDPNARGVGQATTQAVVHSLIMIVIIDGIFASVYYVLGI